MSDTDLKTLAGAIWQELNQPVFPAVHAAVDDLRTAHGDSVAAILFYGSCLRAGTDDDKILDFYVLVDDLGAANHGKISGFFNKLLPPNVFYREIEYEGRVVRSKYGIMSLSAFGRSMRMGRWNTSFWARFAQPAALVYADGPDAETLVIEALAQAVVTAAGDVAPTYNWPFTAEELWGRVFEMTYRAELRSENAAAKGREIFGEYPDRYRQLAGPAIRLAELDIRAGDGGRFSPKSSRLRVWKWRLRKPYGKTLSFLRLVKGSMTFTGGLDYLAWKIRRHSGVDIEVRPWQRKHPLIGGLSLFFKTRRLGGFR